MPERIVVEAERFETCSRFLQVDEEARVLAFGSYPSVERLERGHAKVSKNGVRPKNEEPNLIDGPVSGTLHQRAQGQRLPDDTKPHRDELPDP